jgi:quercetin dioxygenase-like cupin family protein
MSGAMDENTLYGALKSREAAQRSYAGKLIHRAAELAWEASPQGRNAPLVDAKLTGIDCRSFGMVLTELPPASMSGLHQHSFEAAAYILSGEGFEVIGDERVPWTTGDTIYMPPNIPHRHVNTSPDQPARLLQVEAWPLLEHLRMLDMQQFEEAGPGRPPE